MRTAFFCSTASETPSSGRSASSRYSREEILRPSRSSLTEKSRTTQRKCGKNWPNSVPLSSPRPAAAERTWMWRVRLTTRESLAMAAPSTVPKEL